MNQEKDLQAKDKEIASLKAAQQASTKITTHQSQDSWIRPSLVKVNHKQHIDLPLPRRLTDLDLVFPEDQV